MTVLQVAPGGAVAPTSVPDWSREYDWPHSAEMELWALRVRIEAACRKGEARQGWVSCRVLRQLAL